MSRVFRAPGPAGKLFLAVLAGCVLLVGGMLLALRLSFQAGFSDYLDESRQERLSLLADTLSDEYRKDSGWHALHGNERAFRRLVGRIIRREPAGKGETDDAAEKARRQWETAYLRSGLGVLGADGKTKIVGVPPGPDAFRLAITVEGTTVGYLTREPLADFPEAADQRFAEHQLRAGMVISLAALVVAALISAWAARLLNAPLQSLGGVLAALAKGDYTARAPAAGRGQLRVFADQLSSLADTLARNENARRIFMAEISHDLRTPLAVLRGEIEAVQDGIRPLTPQSLDSLQAEIALLSGLVDDIHTLALADLGSLAYDRRPLDLVCLVRETLNAFTERFAGRGLALSHSLPDMVLPVFADAGRLGQAMRNILENSLRYTNPGGTVQVHCREEQGLAVLDILDSAPSVPEKDLPRLFERFQTQNPARCRAAGGSGLGLSICRTIVEAHGGTVRALPSPLGGLWLRLSLPAEGAGASL